MLILATLVTLTLLFGVICHIVAEKNGRRRALWLVLGLVFGPFALAALLIMGKPKTLGTDSDIAK